MSFTLEYKEKTEDGEDEEEKLQERLNKRFAKRARMQRLEEMYADSQEFSQQRLMDEDPSMMLELQKMKNPLARKRSVSSGSRSSFSQSSESQTAPLFKRQRSGGSFGGSFLAKTGSLSVALQSGRSLKRRTSFLGGKSGDSSSTSSAGLVHKSVSLGHVVFSTGGKSNLSNSTSCNGSNLGKRKQPGASNSGGSLFSRAIK
jgi:hypothetical protein